MDGSEHTVPVAASRLTEQSHARVPRAVSTLQQPTPIRHVLKCNPGRAAQRPGQMRQRGVTGDDEVEMAHDRCAVEKSLRPRVEVVSEHLHRQVRCGGPLQPYPSPPPRTSKA